MTTFDTLPWTDNYEGKPRQVGVELEMAGVDADQIASAVTDELGGRFEPESAFSGYVRDSELGEFRIELDAEVLTSRGYLDSLRRLGISIEPGELRDNLESVLSRLAGLVVPHELVCPPIGFDALPRLDAVRANLRAAGAQGTQSSALYAFGLQFNVEIHDRSATELLSVLRAFLLRFDAIVEREDIDLSRKLSPYVQPFPEDYVVHVLDPDYAPDQSGLIDDYLHFTPTRNRPLDVLPLFAWMDEERVAAAPVEHSLIKSRPTWHYRLPNCRIDDREWNLSTPWKAWAEIEHLASRPSELNKLAEQRLRDSSRIRRWWAATWRSVRGRGERE